MGRGTRRAGWDYDLHQWVADRTQPHTRGRAVAHRHAHPHPRTAACHPRVMPQGLAGSGSVPSCGPSWPTPGFTVAAAHLYGIHLRLRSTTPRAWLRERRETHGSTAADERHRRSATSTCGGPVVRPRHHDRCDPPSGAGPIHAKRPAQPDRPSLCSASRGRGAQVQRGPARHGLRPPGDPGQRSRRSHLRSDPARLLRDVGDSLAGPFRRALLTERRQAFR